MTPGQFFFPKNKVSSFMVIDFSSDLNNSFLASCDFFRLLITFANSLDPEQDQQNLDLNRLML